MSLEKRKILKYLEMKIVVITIVGYRAMSPKPWMAMAISAAMHTMTITS